MNAIAQAIAGSALLTIGAIFTLYGVSYISTGAWYPNGATLNVVVIAGCVFDVVGFLGLLRVLLGGRTKAGDAAGQAPAAK